MQPWEPYSSHNRQLPSLFLLNACGASIVDFPDRKYYTYQHPFRSFLSSVFANSATTVFPVCMLEMKKSTNYCCKPFRLRSISISILRTLEVTHGLSLSTFQLETALNLTQPPSFHPSFLIWQAWNLHRQFPVPKEDTNSNSITPPSHIFKIQ